jgi:hypothetical protein
VVTLRKRVKIEVADGDREKVTITLEGDMSRERILHLMDLLQLLDITDKAKPQEPEEISKFEKIRLLLRRKFPTGWFTSQDVMVAYEDSYEEPIGLSTVSTYLVRLVERGDVTRSGGVATRRYRTRRTEISGEGNRSLPNLD